MQYGRPVIAVTASRNAECNRLVILELYMKMLMRHGAIPVLLPMTTDESLTEEIVDRFDGIVISGGGDIDSANWGEPLHEKAYGIDAERDAFELALARLIHRKKKPALCICRGEQVMNVALGGTLYQDIPSQAESAVNHRCGEIQFEVVHNVTVKPGTKLAAIVGEGTLGVNSLHHQAVREAAPCLTVSAVAEDGIIEAIECPDHPFFIGLQWHPERLGASNNGADAVFAAFCKACGSNNAR